jgi:hypothetical protein
MTSGVGLDPEMMTMMTIQMMMDFLASEVLKKEPGQSLNYRQEFLGTV